MHASHAALPDLNFLVIYFISMYMHNNHCHRVTAQLQLIIIIIIIIITRRRWEDNIKMDLQEVGRGCGDWMELAQDRDRWRGACEYGNELGVP